MNAVDQAVIRNVSSRSADWYGWCDRHGFTEYSLYAKPAGRRYWSRQHFKEALKLLPLGDPDRWKYEVGSRYAPMEYATGFFDWRGLAKAMIQAFVLGVIGFIAALLLAAYVSPLFLIYPAVYVAWWVRYYVIKWKVLSS